MQPEHESLAAAGVDRMPDGTLSPTVTPPTAIPVSEHPTLPTFSFDDADDLPPLPDHAPRSIGRTVLISVAAVAVIALVGGLILHARQTSSVPLAYSYG